MLDGWTKNIEKLNQHDYAVKLIKRRIAERGDNRRAKSVNWQKMSRQYLFKDRDMRKRHQQCKIQKLE